MIINTKNHSLYVRVLLIKGQNLQILEKNKRIKSDWGIGTSKKYENKINKKQIDQLQAMRQIKIIKKNRI